MSETEIQVPPAEVLAKVRASFLILGNNLLSGLDDFNPNSSLTAAFITKAQDGLRSVISAGSIPFTLVSHSERQRYFDRIHIAERIRNLQYVEHGQDPSEEINKKSIQGAEDKVFEFLQTKEGVNYFRDRIVNELYHSLMFKDVEEAAYELLVQSPISIWAVFESSVREFIVLWINADPRRAKLVLSSADLKGYFGKQVVDISVIDDHGFDLTSSMGDILFRDRRLDNLGVIRSVLEALFSHPSLRQALAEDMWMLNQRRHLFVHRRGMVDAEYLKRTGDPVPVGQRLTVTSSDIEHYISAVQGAFVAIAGAADSFV